MKIQLEVFIAKIEDNNILYVRKEMDLSSYSENPDLYVDEMVEKVSQELKVDKEKCIIHSTSWRCAHCDLISLTYIVYSDYLDFVKSVTKKIPIEQLELAEGTINKPHPTHLEEKNIVAHSLRHVSMLVKKNPETYKPALAKSSFEAFNEIAISLAGKIN